MANLDYKSRSLSQLYVFYERLNTEFNGKNKILYDRVSSSLNKVRNEYRENFRIVSKLRSMSEHELKKELSLLENIFQVPLHIDFKRAGSAKELIDTLNSYMNLKEVYQRSINLLRRDETYLSVAQYFYSYFSTLWDNQKNGKGAQIINEILGKITSKDKKQHIIKIADEVLTQRLPELVEEAIENMLNSNEISGKEDNKAYSDLIKGINKVYGKNSFANQLYNLYHIDELKQSILEAIQDSSKKNLRTSMSKVKAEKIVGRNKYSDGGISLEYLENLTANEIIDGLKNMKHAKIATGGAIHSGASGVKADNIIAFNIDPKVIEEALESNEKISRERNYQMIKDLGDKIAKIDNGFIVYSNAKNYALNNNFHGFSSGDKLSLEKYRGLMAHIQGNIDTFIGGIMQTMSGAIGQHMRFDFQEWIVEDIAYFLFDDFETIGVPQSSGTSLHIFNLDGIMVPLSFFLWLLAEAIEKGVRNPHDIVKAQINAGTIKWTQEQAVYSYDMWLEQRDEALKNITISVSFLQDFKNIMKEFLI